MEKNYKLTIIVDTNDGDYEQQVYQFDETELETYKRVAKIVKDTFSWPSKIDIRDKTKGEIMNLLSEEDGNFLIQVLNKYKSSYYKKESIYSDLFSSWNYWNEMPHTLEKVLIEKTENIPF